MVEKFRKKRSVVEAVFDLYERLAKDGIECSMTVDDKKRSVVEAVFDLYERLAKDGIECSMTVDDKKRSVVEAVFDLYERLAKGGIECSMTVDDKNGIYTIYCHGVELADNSERINKSFEDVLEEEKNDQ